LITRIIFGEEYRSLSSSLKVNTPYTAKVQCPKNYKASESNLSLQDEFQEYPLSGFKLVTRSSLLNTYLWALKRHFTFHLTVILKALFSTTLSKLFRTRD
jgi:hypothetical protein